MQFCYILGVNDMADNGLLLAVLNHRSTTSTEVHMPQQQRGSKVTRYHNPLYGESLLPLSGNSAAPPLVLCAPLLAPDRHLLCCRQPLPAHDRHLPLCRLRPSWCLSGPSSWVLCAHKYIPDCAAFFTTSRTLSLQTLSLLPSVTVFEVLLLACPSLRHCHCLVPSVTSAAFPPFSSPPPPALFLTN